MNGARELAHHRQREVAVVAIAVVEGEAGEAAREVALAHPPVHLVERDDVDVELADMVERRAQEVRRDFEVPVRLERVVPRRPDVVQHEDGADACEQGSQQAVRTAEIECLEPGAEDVAA